MIGDLTVWCSTDGGQRWNPWYTDPDASRRTITTVVALPANPFGDSMVLAYGNQVLRRWPSAWEVKEGSRRPIWDTFLTDEELPGRPSQHRRA